MAPSYQRRPHGHRTDARAVAVGLVAAVEERLRPVVLRTRAKMQRLWNSPAERAQFARDGARGFRNAIPWPPIVEVLLIILWIRALNWGEQSSFSDAVSKCSWDKWEDWPAGAAPYRIAFVADPQLVDPHTYPGRPWPLSTLTVKHTDQYLRRSFGTILGSLHPRSVLFLGDLFDGGREWSTEKSHSPERRYRRYGDQFWLSEYTRFGRIFVDPWLEEQKLRGVDSEASFEANLPGNHDLGIAAGVQLPVRDRFSLYFGAGNKIQVLGNHTFVTVDSVSLSARMEQDAAKLGKIWEPTNTFLNEAKKKQVEVVRRALRARSHQKEKELYRHVVLDTERFHHSHSPTQDGDEGEDGVSELPTILLTHVPLYRVPGTPCGPLREKYPPTKSNDGKPLESDDPNSIKVQGGYQYQNVLHPDISNDLVTKIGGIKHVFSGDDHDYCEIEHHGYTSKGGAAIREITVKSISWAMGVRHPGFQLMSLWNPLATNSEGVTFSPGGHIPDGTIQTHLCILPDQLGIFIHYGKLIGLTVIVVLGRALFSTLRNKGPGPRNASYLPIDEQEMHPLQKANGHSGHSSTSSSSRSSEGATSLRPGNNKAPRATTPLSGYNYQKEDKPDRGADLALSLGRTSRGKPPGKPMLFLQNTWISLRFVAFFALLWYFWLMRTV